VSKTKKSKQRKSRPRNRILSSLFAETFIKIHKKGSVKFHSISKSFKFILIFQPKRAKLKFCSA